MTYEQPQQLAGDAGIRANIQNTPKEELIRKIQLLRGVEPCFATEKSHDCAELCQWRRDCRRPKAVWHR